MKRDFDVVIERDADGYFVGSVPACPGCHTQAKSLDPLIERMREAINLWLEEHSEVSRQIDFVGVRRVSVTV